MKILSGRWFGVSVLAGSLMTLGCGGSTPETSNRVVFWQFWPKATIEPLVDKFEAENPDLEVVVEMLTWQSGQEKITAAEELVQLQEKRVQSLEDLYSAGRASFADLASAQTGVANAKIRVLNYKQDRYVAEAAMPLLMDTVREKVIVAERAVEIREELVGEVQRLYEAGRGSMEDLDSARSLLMEDRIRVLNFRQELYTAEAVFGITERRDTK